MKKQLGIGIALSLGLLSANVAMANDAVLGALLGGGAGVLVGRSVGGRNGAVVGGALGAAAGAVIGSEQNRYRVGQRGDYYSPPPVYYSPPPGYYSQQPYYPPQQVYYTQPVRIVTPPVYYIRGGYYRGGPRHHQDHDRYRGERHR